MRGAVVVAAVVVAVVAVADGCAFFGQAPVPCEGPANCPASLFCVDNVCVKDDVGPEAEVGRCGIASRAVVDASLAEDDAANRRFKTIRAAVAAVTTSAAPEPCIDILAGAYSETGAITLPPGTILKGDNSFQRGTQQTVRFGRVGDAPTGFLITSAVIDGLRLEGNGTLIAAVAADLDVDLALIESTVANGGGVLLQTQAALAVVVTDSTILQGALSIDAPAADVGIVRTVFDRTRIDVTRGAALTITGGEVLVGDDAMLLSTTDTQLFDVTVRPFPNAPGCTAGVIVAGGAARFNDVRFSDLPCPALIVRDEITAVTSVVLGTTQNQRVRFEGNSIDVVVDLDTTGSTTSVEATAVDRWSFDPECGEAACVCDVTSAIDTDDGACSDLCTGANLCNAL